MIWRILVLLAIVLGWASGPLTQAEPLPDAADLPINGVTSQFVNDNNLIDTLFQTFNGNEEGDGGHKEKTSVGPLPAPVSAPASPASVTDGQARARAGRETTIFLTNDHVVVRVPAALADDLEVKIQLAKGYEGAPPPGAVIGDLIFTVSAQAPGGDALPRLPIEANLSARYTDAELGSRDETKIVLSWQDPADGTWKPAPKPAADPRNNFVSATIQDLGLYAVHQAP